jgi:hypothetical protein
MSIGSVSLNYTLKNFPIKKNFDTRVNVKTELEYLRFGSNYTSEALSLSYINSPGIDPENNILLIDKSNNINSNAKESFKENRYLSDNFLIDYAGFYIADVVKNIDGEETPLYFWHDMSDAENPINIEILDSSKVPVDPKLWTYFDETATLDYSRKGIYSNLICYINKKEKAYEVFYVRYKDLNTNLVVEKLLDSRPYYSQASFIQERTKREYIITQVQSEYDLRIVFDSLNYSPTPLTGSQRFWLKRKSTSKITIEKPGIVSSSERWNLRITPGDFFNNDFKYWVPEYYLQLFSPAFPYRLVKEKKATLINKNLIHLDVNPIADLGLDGYYIYIIVKEQNGAVKRCFTNDLNADTYITKQGFVTDIFYEKEAIESVSANSGFILLNQDIEESQEVFVTCRYIEQYYSYDFLSVNPSINSEVLGKKIIIYLEPDASDRAVHHLIVDSNDLIVDASKEEYLAAPLTYEDWKNIAEANFFLELGEVYITQTLSIPDISLLDTRVLGGGISEKNIESALKLQNEVSWYWDSGNWDGTPYPGMGAIIVSLPRSILKEMNGEFDRDQVAEIVKKHSASGSYIIIKYYDESTEIEKIELGNKEAKITWYLVNASQYNIYIGNSPDNLSLYSSEPGTRTHITISNLENDKNYYVQIAPVIGGIERLGSRILGFMPFNYSSTLPNVKYGDGRFIQGSYG